MILGPARIMVKSAIIYRGKLQAGMYLEVDIREADVARHHP